MMKVFVTGGTGFIGSVVVEKLLAAGHQVSGLARSDEAAAKLEARGAEVVRGDLYSREVITQAAKQADAVMHIGASRGEDNAEADKSAAHIILDALEGSGKPFIYTSGTLVYGNTGEQIVDENTPLSPGVLMNARAQTEQEVIKAAERNIRTVVLRLPIVFGRGGGMVGFLMQSAKQQGAAAYIGQGDNAWAFVHVDDAAESYLLALEKAPAGTLLNIASGESVPYKVVAEAASKAGGAEGRTVSLTLEQAVEAMGWFAEAMTFTQHFSNSKAKEVLGWEPKAPLLLEELAAQPQMS
jgi:nucleoside-diphosphate-sugar epimerase